MANPSKEGTAPRLVTTCEVGALPIGALERFVLSRIDGRRSPEQLAELTGIGEGDVERILAKLVSLGAVSLAGSDAKKGVAAPTVEAVDLDAEMQRWIVERHDALELSDHYALLGIARDADRKAIKAAYYALASKLHTDRYFGKKLGTFKAKMEAVFSRVTLAHDVLSNKDRRAEYEAYLVERERTQAYERLMAMVEGEGDLSEELRNATPAKAAIPLSSAAMPVATPARPGSIPPAPPLGEPLGATAPLTPEQERARREALARRLTRNTTGSRKLLTPTQPMPALRPQPTPQDAKAATDALRRMYEERKNASRRFQAKKFVDAADEALVKDDVVTAANHLRLALRYTEDPDVQRKFEMTNRRARDVLADAYLKQARYEEQNQRWREAAHSYAKAIDGRPDDPELQHAAANALRREGRDLHAAARHGEAAVQKNPKNVPFRVTLGHVYLDAGLFLRARSELEQALKLEPGHARAKELLVQVKKLVS